MILKAVNSMLSVAGLELTRCSQRECVRSFLPFRQTLAEAAKARLSVGDYIDAKYQVPGATQATIDQLMRFGILSPKIQSVCEIGPGSGRYLEKTQRLCEPRSYETYETDQEWSDWLVRTYHVIAHKADGTTLRETPSESVDLIQAHKVFVYLPFIVTCQYFAEMIRVARPGGYIVFDIISEKCLPDATIEEWIADRIYARSMMPREFVVDFFARRQCALVQNFLSPNLPGQSEYLLLVKNGQQLSL